MVYYIYIIQKSTISNYSIQNQRDIFLDTAENLTQIGQWTLSSFHKEQRRIELFLTLTRKNLRALNTFPLSPALQRDFKKFCESFDKLEEEYRTGILDRTVWANGFLKWGSTLSQNVHLL
ncbi:MAG: hypothetical protein AAB457_04525 [Patescibacteria group bacterium]